MKKILFMAAMLLSATSIFAQHETGSFNIQPKVGMNIASVTETENSNPRIDLVVGAELEYQVTDLFSLSGGVLYSMQGVKTKDDDYNKGTIKMDYINIPILANFYVAKNFAIKFGVQPAFNVNAKGIGLDEGEPIKTDIEGAKSFDFSIPVGVSYEFKNFQLDARYNWGLTKIVPNDGDYYKRKNSVFQITLGYKINL